MSQAVITAWLFIILASIFTVIGVVSIIIPNQYVFENVELGLGAGKLSLEVVGEECDYKYKVKCGKDYHS